MTISSTTNRVSFAGNGSTTAFATGFKFFANTDLTVILVVDSTGVETTQTITTNYTVAGAGEAAGGTVTMLVAPATGETLVIVRAQPYTQGLDLVENDEFPSDSVEQTLDKTVIMTQQNKDAIDRSVQLSEGDTSGFNPTLPSTHTANTALVVNSAGTGWDVGPTTSAISAAAANAAAAAASAAAASTSESNAAASEAAALAAVGGVKVSSNDTTAAGLEIKLLPGTGLSASTQNDGANETRTMSVDPNNATDTVITADDEILFADASDGNNPKKDTVRGILDLAIDTVARDMAASALAYTIAQNDATSITGSVGAFNLSDDFESDSLATKTNATYDASGDYYHNPVAADPRVTGATPTSPVFPVDVGVIANINDDDTGTEAGIGTSAGLGNLTAAAVAARIVAQLDYGSNQTITKIDCEQVRTSGGATSDTGAQFYYSTNGTTWTAYGATFTIPVSGSPTDISQDSTEVTARYIALVAGQTNYGGAGVYLKTLNGFEPGVSPNMTLAPTAASLAVANPTDLISYVVIDPQEVVTVGTDIVMTGSIDGGTTDATGSWTKVGDIGVSGEELYRVDIDVSAQTGSSLTYEITTANAKEIRYHDCVGIVAVY